jgi:hypothetical protein
MVVVVVGSLSGLLDVAGVVGRAEARVPKIIAMAQITFIFNTYLILS